MDAFNDIFFFFLKKRIKFEFDRSWSDKLKYKPTYDSIFSNFRFDNKLFLMEKNKIWFCLSARIIWTRKKKYFFFQNSSFRYKLHIHTRQFYWKYSVLESKIILSRFNFKPLFSFAIQCRPMLSKMHVKLVVVLNGRVNTGTECVLLYE